MKFLYSNFANISLYIENMINPFGFSCDMDFIKLVLKINTNRQYWIDYF